MLAFGALKVEFFQFSSKTNTVCEKAVMFQLSLWATKLRNTLSYLNDWIGLQKSVIF